MSEAGRCQIRPEPNLECLDWSQLEPDQELPELKPDQLSALTTLPRSEM